MEKKFSKEELVAALAKKEKAVEEFMAADEQKRKTISQFLDAPFKKKGQWDYDTERITYTWPEIYFALGKLKVRQDTLNFAEKLQEVDSRLLNLERNPELN